MRLKQAHDSHEFEVEAKLRDGGRITAIIDGRELEATLQPLGDGSAMLSVGDRRVRVFGLCRGHSILIAAGPFAFEFARVEGRSSHAVRGLATPEVTAPMPGKILKVLVSAGDRVEAGQPLIVMEAMKMETTLSAESPAIVKEVRVAAGAMVDHGAVLIELSALPDSSPRESGPPDL